MYFSYQNLRVLQWLNGSRYEFSDFYHFNNKNLSHVIKKDQRKGFYAECGKRIECISNSFVKAATDTFGVLEHIGEHARHLPHEACVIILNSKLYLYHCEKGAKNGPRVRIYYFMEARYWRWYVEMDLETMMLAIMTNQETDWCLKYKGDTDELHPRLDEIRKDFGTIISTRLCKVYGEIYDDIVCRDRRTKDREKATEQHESEIKEEIHMLSIHWLKNSFRLEGFSVRRHQRWHFKRAADCTYHELTWVRDFKKTGYNRKAGLLQNQEITTQRYLEPLQEQGSLAQR